MIRLLVVLTVLIVSGCQQSRLVTRTETIEVPHLRYVPLKTEWTADTPVPATPPLNCIWTDAGLVRPTICIEALTEWRKALSEALDSANADKAAIRAVQPK